MLRASTREERLERKNDLELIDGGRSPRVKENDRVNAVWCTGAKCLRCRASGFKGFTAGSPICERVLPIYPRHS